MSGLIYKDLRLMRSYWRFFLPVLGIYLVLVLAGAMDESILYAMLGVALLVLPVNSISYDAQCGWNSYCAAMPLSPHKVVGSKYLLPVLFLLLSCVLILLMQLILQLFGRASGTLVELLPLLLSFIAAALAVNAFQLPLLLIFGPEKGRIVMLGMCVLLAAIVAFCKDVFPADIILGAFPLALAAGLVLYGISFYISLHIYLEQEY